MALTTNLDHYYKMDGNSTDAVGSNNGTDTTVTYSNANGIINNGVGFTASGSNVAIGAITWGTTMSLNFWIKGTMGDGNFAFDSTGSRMFIVFQAGPTTVQASWGGAALTKTMNSLGSGFNMFTFTTDGVTGIWYQNATSIGSGAMAPSSITTTIQYIGNNNVLSSQLTVPIDEIGIWSRALSGAEVTSLYNGGVGLQYPFSSGTSLSTRKTLLGVGV